MKECDRIAVRQNIHGHFSTGLGIYCEKSLDFACWIDNLFVSADVKWSLYQSSQKLFIGIEYLVITTVQSMTNQSATVLTMIKGAKRQF